MKEDTERDYSQTEYRKTLVFGDGGADGETLQVMPIQGNDVGGKIEWIRGNRNHWQWTMVLIHEDDAERDYNQTGYGKNILIVGDRWNSNSYPEFAVERQQRTTQENDARDRRNTLLQ